MFRTEQNRGIDDNIIIFISLCSYFALQLFRSQYRERTSIASHYFQIPRFRMSGPTSDSSNLPTGGSEMNFNLLSSEREVLMAKAEKVIADYNKGVEDDQKWKR